MQHMAYKMEAYMQLDLIKVKPRHNEVSKINNLLYKLEISQHQNLSPGRSPQNISWTDCGENLSSWGKRPVMQVIETAYPFSFGLAVIVAILNCDIPITRWPDSMFDHCCHVASEKGATETKKGRRWRAKPVLSPSFSSCWRQQEERPPTWRNPQVSNRWN